MRNHLVLSVIGDESVHRTWLAGKRSFDLCLVYYGATSGRFRDDADIYIEQKGIKFSLIHTLARTELAEVLPRYDQIWLPDDDIAADTSQIHDLFAIAAKYKLAICQPAIGKGQVTYRCLAAQPQYLLRYSRFVELMCPMFSRDAFARMLPTFDSNLSGWGLDWLWPTYFGAKELAVIDAVAVDHTRPVGSGGVHSEFAKRGVSPQQEFNQIVRQLSSRRRRYVLHCRDGYPRMRCVRREGRRAWTESWLTSLRRRMHAEVSAST
jgi:hypothetical protein